MNNVLAKLSELEERVAGMKDWKQRYEEEKSKWDEEKKELLKKAEGVDRLREAMIEFLNLDRASVPVGVGKTIVNLEHKDLVINLAHGEKEVNLTTGIVVGKVLYCALTELSKEGFSEAELSEALNEHGWNVPHNTLAPTLGGLVRDGNLVRLKGARPVKYRLPQKVKLNVKS